MNSRNPQRPTEHSATFTHTRLWRCAVDLLEGEMLLDWRSDSEEGAGGAGVDAAQQFRSLFS